MIAKKLFVLFTIGIVTMASTASAQTSQPAPIGVRQSDSVLNGALIGAGVGVASHLLMCRTMEPWEVCRNDFGPMLKFAALGAGAGAGIDALIRKKVYQSGATEVHAAPLLGRRVTGVQLSVAF